MMRVAPARTLIVPATCACAANVVAANMTSAAPALKKDVINASLNSFGVDYNQPACASERDTSWLSN